jgi:vacuolar-type H+-ATPase subunit E/Vma4
MTGKKADPAVQNLKKPTPKVKTRRKGKKSIPFQEDPEILARLDSVSQMVIAGAKSHNIAATFDYSIASAKRDIARVRQLWNQQAKDSINDARARALATYQEIITRTFEELGKPENAGRKHVLFGMILAAQKEIDRIQGVGPLSVVLSGSVEVTEDIEAVRKRRWEQIKPQVAEMLKQQGVKV